MEGNTTNGGIEDAEARLERLLDNCSATSGSGGGYRLFNRQRSMHQIIGGGKAADVILWKCRWMSISVIIVATAAWFLFEKSGLSSLTICSDIMLLLVLIQFIRYNGAVFLNKQLQPLPELVLSEEMINSVAASFRVKFNNMLMMAHDITLGKDFRIFFQVAIILWLLSVIGGFFSFFTMSYIGTIVSITLPALYNKYEDTVGRFVGLVHQKISKYYKIVEENVISRLRKHFSKIKDA